MKNRSKKYKKPSKVSPSRFDPTRTGTLRRALSAEIGRRFALIKGQLVKLILDDDSLGLKEMVHDPFDLAANAFCPTGPGGGKDNSCGSGSTTLTVNPLYKEHVEKIYEKLGLDGPIHETLPRIVGALPGSTITVKRHNDNSIMVETKHPDYKSERILRVLSDGEKYIENDSIRVLEQGTGLGSKIFANQVAAASSAGFTHIETMAHGYGDSAPVGGIKKEASDKSGTNGYYTWPLLGYDGKLPKHAKAEFPEVESILDLMSSKQGRDWWKANGTTIHNAKFDLTPGSRSMQVMEAYLEERSKRSTSGSTKNSTWSELGAVWGSSGLTSNVLGEKHDFASTHFEIECPVMLEAFSALQSTIDPADIIKLENDPHITVRYGLHDTPEMFEKVSDLAMATGSVVARIKGLSLFHVGGEPTDNVFCPTGKGGGIDPTCSIHDVQGDEDPSESYDEPSHTLRKGEVKLPWKMAFPESEEEGGVGDGRGKAFNEAHAKWVSAGRPRALVEMNIPLGKDDILVGQRGVRSRIVQAKMDGILEMSEVEGYKFNGQYYIDNGHHTLLAAKKLGYKTVKAVISDLDLDSVITNKEAQDVLKWDIDSPQLYHLNRELGLLPNTQTYDYHPHLTVAYLKAGTGQKYCKEPWMMNGHELWFDRLVISSSDETKETITINCGGKGGTKGPCPTSSEYQKRVEIGQSAFPHAVAPYNKNDLGISRSQKIALPETEVHFSELHTVQKTVNPTGVDYFVKGGTGPAVGKPIAVGSKFLNVGPYAVRTYDGKLYLEDGNTRLSALAVLGKTSASIRVVQLDKHGKWIGKPTTNVPGCDNITVNEPWRFELDAEKIRLFQQWLKKQLAQYLIGKTEEELWRRYTEEGFKKGAGRAFDDTRPQDRAKSLEGQEKLDFYNGTKEEFLRSSFGRPVAIEKVQFLASRSFDEIRGLTETMTTQLTRTLSDGLVQGKGAKEIARDLTKALDISRQRAEVIARTEIVRAHAEGQLIAFEELEVEELGVAVEWATAGDERVCPLCRPLEGAIFKVAEAKGMLPRHPQCRCAWIPAGIGEATAGQQRSQAKIVKAVKTSQKRASKNDKWKPAQPLSKNRPQPIITGG